MKYIIHVYFIPMLDNDTCRFWTWAFEEIVTVSRQWNKEMHIWNIRSVYVIEFIYTSAA